MQHIAAIQTRFKGYLFRSRLEARWAVFFDRCREQFIYEAEGFRLPSGPYLPDFYLQNPPGFVEVKPVSMLPTRNFEFGPRGSFYPICDDFPLELELIWELRNATGVGGCVVYGDPLDALAMEFDYGNSRGGIVVTSKFGLVIGTLNLAPKLELKEAAVAAREARFEHGATA